MSKIIRVELQDGLLLPSGYLAQADYTCILYLRVPDEWLEGDTLLEPQQELVLENMYGRSWRQGNEDGSRYVVLVIRMAVLTPQQVDARVWLPQLPAELLHHWYYYVTGDGQFQGTTPEQFNL